MKTYQIILLIFFVLCWGWLLKYFVGNYRRANRKLALDRKSEEMKRKRQEELRKRTYKSWNIKRN